nr:hypothetical protein [Tanacetum cinerariifolium]
MIPILDTGKLEKWKLRIQQYLENEHYALWEVIEFGDSYKAPPKETCKGPASESSTRMKGRTVAITTEDMHKRRNDVKARKTLLLALPDKHQLRFSKYETAKELWEAILKTFETLEQTFNRLQVIVSHLEFIDVEIEQDDLNQKFLTSLAPEWPMKNTKNLNTKISKLNEELSDCETDLYNYKRGLSQVKARLIEFKENEVKFYERIRVLKRDIEIKDNKIEYLKNELEQVKKEKESLDNKLTRFGNASKDLDDLLGSQRSDKNKEGLGYSAVPPSPAQIYLPPKKELSWTGFPEFLNDTITGYRRPTPSSIMSKPMIKFVKEADCPRVIKINNTKNARKSTMKYAEMYRNISKGTSRIELFKEYSWPVLDWPHWIETTDQETKIIVTDDGKPRTISESSLRRHLKLNDEEGISSLPDAELFENLSLMGYNILPSQRTVPLFTSMIVTHGEGLANPTEPHHTPSPQEHQSPQSDYSPQHDSPPLSHQTIILEPIPHDLQAPTETLIPRRLTKRAIRIAQSKALSPDVDEPASLLRDDRHGEAFLTVSSLDAGQDRDIEISGLKARVKSLDDKESRRKEPIQGDAPITGGIIDIREELGADKSTEKESNDIKEMVNVLSSMEAANILSSGGAA